MRQVGTAKKRFMELVHGDKLYYIDPKTPTEISELTIKEVRKAVDHRYVVIVYFKSDEATKVITGMVEQNIKSEKEMPLVVEEFKTENKIFNADLLDSIPVGKIIVDKNASECMAHTLPPTVYMTNKRALEKFMGK